MMILLLWNAFEIGQHKRKNNFELLKHSLMLSVIYHIAVNTKHTGIGTSVLITTAVANK